jgi:hypothetical protein
VVAILEIENLLPQFLPLLPSTQPSSAVSSRFCDEGQRCHIVCNCISPRSTSRPTARIRSGLSKFLSFDWFKSSHVTFFLSNKELQKFVTGCTRATGRSTLPRKWATKFYHKYEIVLGISPLLLVSLFKHDIQISSLTCN